MCFTSHIWQYAHLKMNFLLWNLKLVRDVLQPPLELNDKVFYHFFRGFSLKTSWVLTKISPEARNVLTWKKQIVAHVVDDNLRVWFSGCWYCQWSRASAIVQMSHAWTSWSFNYWRKLVNFIILVQGGEKKRKPNSISCFLNIKAIID